MMPPEFIHRTLKTWWDSRPCGSRYVREGVTDVMGSRRDEQRIKWLHGTIYTFDGPVSSMPTGLIIPRRRLREFGVYGTIQYVTLKGNGDPL